MKKGLNLSTRTDRKKNALKLVKDVEKEFKAGKNAREIAASHINSQTRKPYSLAQIYSIISRIEN